jgi:hypothetical protein
MNKNKIIITLIIAALFAPMLTQAQSNKRKGAPNSVRNQSEGNSINRQSVRKPFGGNSNQRGSKRGERKPQTGMTRTESGQQHRHDVDMKEVLDLSDKQATQLRSIHKKWHKVVKAIKSDKELSEEQKKVKLRGAFKRMDAVIRRLLNKEQYAKLVKIRRDRARPHGNNKNNLK